MTITTVRFPAPTLSVAFITLPEESAETRVRRRDRPHRARRTSTWICDACGTQQHPTCPHATTMQSSIHSFQAHPDLDHRARRIDVRTERHGSTSR